MGQETGSGSRSKFRSGLGLTRREFVAGAGALIVSFALLPRLSAGQAAQDARAPTLPGSLKDTPMLDAWIRVGADGTITVFTGKVEFGQGVKTALVQLAAEELFVGPARIELVTADTSRTPNEGYTAGSNSMKDSGTAIMNAAAQVREMLVGMAASRFGVAADSLSVQDGSIRAADGRSVAYAELVAGQSLHVPAQPQSRLRDAKSRTIVGKALPRLDIPGKLTGAVAYVHDLRLPNMVHARIVRPPSYGARLRALDSSATEKVPGVIKVVRDGSFVAVVADREFQAIGAMRSLFRGATWDEQATLSPQSEVYAELQSLPHDDYLIRGDATPSAKTWSVESSYRRPYQMHAAIGPSCAVALFEAGKLTVWTHSQGVYPLKGAIAEMLRLPAEAVRCIHMEGSGCYGHNAADDAAADAALIAVAIPGRPVRVQWMREQENLWEPFGSAMLTTAKATLDGQGTITDWQFDVWSGTHSSRPGQAGNLAAAWLLQSPFALPTPKPIPQPEGGGDRNAVPLYDIANARVAHHFIPKMPLRVSALRSLGAYMNVFSIESFMDELALAAKVDPVVFRLRHLKDARAQDVIRLAAERFGWNNFQERESGKRRGRGFAFARYKNLGAYAAVAMEVDVDRESGRIDVVRVVAAVDSGDVVNPDGIRNQIEGGIVQSLSWSLYESVAFDDTRITSRDWSSYPIMRFASVPRSIDVHIIDRPGAPFLGTGEAAQGPAAAALANALASAAGVRIRELPLTSKRVKAAIGV
ncbi:MAG TPA: molybdopterin cofactor-binding domain-containing protein [Casimicrobiaceae bacterium]|nr:molybdopterin cofactor-binding domain-containing protein [Casimicrobiaceae bacterium]